MRPKFDPSLLPAAPDFEHERVLWQAGWQRVAGVDEAGRGAFAGPVVAAVVIFPPAFPLQPQLEGVRDSKQMTPGQRQRSAGVIRQLAIAWAVGFSSAQVIDSIGIVPATRLAVFQAVQSLVQPPDYFVLDFLELPQLPQPQLSLVKGDARSLSIAAASILAKTARDAYMVELGLRCPGYGFADHKGYGTSAHRQALERLGTCHEHRRSFRPIRQQLDKEK